MFAYAMRNLIVTKKDWLIQKGMTKWINSVHKLCFINILILDLEEHMDWFLCPMIV